LTFAPRKHTDQTAGHTGLEATVVVTTVRSTNSRRKEMRYPRDTFYRGRIYTAGPVGLSVQPIPSIVWYFPLRYGGRIQRGRRYFGIVSWNFFFDRQPFMKDIRLDQTQFLRTRYVTLTTVECAIAHKI
jgi:hypothetical protein